MNNSLSSILHAAHEALFTNNNVEAIGDFFAPDYVAHLTDDAVVKGHDSIRKVLERRSCAFHEMEYELEILVEDEHRVAWQRTLRATHAGNFKGFPASGRPIVWRDMVVSQFRDGLISEDWVITDLAERLMLART